MRVKKKKSGTYYRTLKKIRNIWENCIDRDNAASVYRCSATLGKTEEIW